MSIPRLSSRPNLEHLYSDKPKYDYFDLENRRIGQWDFHTIYPCEEFAEAELLLKDQDPVYHCIYHSDMKGRTLEHWLLAYWAYNSMVSASRILSAGPKRFWQTMKDAVLDKTYPRGDYRRQFWKDQAMATILYLEERGVDGIFSDLASCDGKSALSLFEVIKTWQGFGQTCAFKTLDMAQFMGYSNIVFDPKDSEAFLSPAPSEGALAFAAANPLAYQTSTMYSPALTKKKWAVTTLIKVLKNYKAPPRFSEPIGFQDVETVFCNWKKHLKGKYSVGIGLYALKKELLERGDLTRSLYNGGKVANLW